MNKGHTMTRRTIYDYTNEILALYNRVQFTPFYAYDHRDVFPPERINILSQKGFIAKTGQKKWVKPKDCRQKFEWQFTEKSKAFLKRLA